MMSVPSVKPPISTSGMQPTKVGSSPPSSTGSVLLQPSLGTTKSSNIVSSPMKIPVPSNTNHTATLPLSLVQEHKSVNLLIQQQPQSLQQYSPARTEKSRDIVTQGNKPTSNGVEESPTKPQATASVNSGDQKKEETPVMNHASEVPVTLTPPVSSTITVSQDSVTVQNLAITSAATLTITTQGSTTTAVLVNPSKKEESSASVNVAHNTSPANPKSDTSGSEIKTQISNTIIAGSENTEPVKKSTESVKTKREASSKPEFKVATPPRNTKRKREAKSPQEVKAVTPTTTTTTTYQNEDRKPKRARVPTQPYQSPLPELLFNAKVKPAVKAPEEKLIVFYKNEFLAVRNAEGSFFVCQTTQNIYKNTAKIRIRWLSQEKKDNIYVPDFYDTTDFDCILTNLDLKRMSKNKYVLPASELERTQNILKRALDVEKGVLEKPAVTEEHPDGLDLSLYHDETQLKTTPQAKRSNKQKKSKVRSIEHVDVDDIEDENDEVEVDVLAKVEAEHSPGESVSLKKKIKLSPRKADKPKTITKEIPNKEKSKSQVQEKKVDVQEPGPKEKTRDPRKSESANKTEVTIKSALAIKAALTKQAAVKQTVARQALPQPAKEKKKDKDTATAVVKTSVKKPEPVQESGTPKKTRSGRNVAAPAQPPSSPPPAAPPLAMTVTPALPTPSPPKTTLVTRTKENEPQRVTITIKGRKKTSKRT